MLVRAAGGRWQGVRRTASRSWEALEVPEGLEELLDLDPEHVIARSEDLAGMPGPDVVLVDPASGRTTFVIRADEHEADRWLGRALHAIACVQPDATVEVLVLAPTIPRSASAALRLLASCDVTIRCFEIDVLAGPGMEALVSREVGIPDPPAELETEFVPNAPHQSFEDEDALEFDLDAHAADPPTVGAEHLPWQPRSRRVA